MKLEFSRFSKNTQTSNFVKIRPVGAELFREDGRTDVTTLTAAFRNFANSPKNNGVLCWVTSHYFVHITVVWCRSCDGGHMLEWWQWNVLEWWQESVLDWWQGNLMDRQKTSSTVLFLHTSFWLTVYCILFMYPHSADNCRTLCFLPCKEQ